MSWRITPSFTPADEYFQNVSLLLHGDGANGSQTIVDSSPSPKMVTAVGNAQISTVESKFGAASIVFDKVDDRLTLAASSDFAFGTGDFTIEFWAYSRDVSQVTQRGLFQISGSTGGLSNTYTSGIVMLQGANGAVGALGALTVNVNNVNHGFNAGMTVNTWHHIAVTRAGSTVRVFFNGTLGVTATNSANLTAENLVVGGYFSTSFLYDGYIDDLRITKGVARYTANFTPPTAPFPDI